jgi:hypothetical protein
MCLNVEKNIYKMYTKKLFYCVEYEYRFSSVVQSRLIRKVTDAKLAVS